MQIAVSYTFFLIQIALTVIAVIGISSILRRSHAHTNIIKKM